MSFIFDKWNETLVALKTSLSLVGYLPHEVTYEIQNALVHLLVALKSSPSDKRKEIKRAIAHIRRAHLDALKICLFEIHNRLISSQGERDCDNVIKFQKRFAQVRLAELQSLGAGHVETVRDFQEVIREFKDYRDAHNSTWPLPSTALAQTNGNYGIFDYGCRDTLWQWAQLEILLTSLRGQRVYSASYNMVNAYLVWADFKEELQKAVPALKAAIVLVLIRNDCNNTFSDFLNNSEEGATFLSIKEFMNTHSSLSSSDTNRLYNRMVESANAIFPRILAYLGASFQETLQIAA